MDSSQMQTISSSASVIHCCHRVGKSIFAKLQLDTFLLSTITPVHNQVGNKKMYITTSTHFFSNKFFAILFCDD